MTDDRQNISGRTPLVHILLPVHNRRLITERFVECLQAQSWKTWHLILIDDGSKDGTAEMVSTEIPSATILRGDGNLWWAGSLQIGYRWLMQHAADDEVVLILNDDTSFKSDFLANGVRDLPPHSLMLAQLYDQATGDFCEAGVHWDWKRLACRGENDPALINCFSTRGLFLRVSDMRQIGGFHPRVLPHYLSDYEYTIRAHRMGFRLTTSKTVFLYYDETSTGIREFKPASLGEALRSALSKRATYNPVYWTSFVLFASPFRYKLPNTILVWRRFLSSLQGAVATHRRNQVSRQSD